MKQEKKPVADVLCPTRGCEELVPVYKFEARASSESRSRFAGRLYCVCPKHGRYDNSEYILNSEGIKWRNGITQESAAAVEAQPKQEDKQEAKPVQSKASPPVNKSSEAKAEQVTATKAKGWGWFQ